LSIEMQRRKDDALARTDIVALIGKVVKLGRGAKPRGQCPFHGSKSDSFVVDKAGQRAKCWGCDWSGDAIRFVMDNEGLSFVDALARLEDGAGGAVTPGAMVQREKIERTGKGAGRGDWSDDRPRVSSLEMGLWLVDHAGRDLGPPRTYLRARGVPEAMLDDRRLRDIRFIAAAPIVPWAQGEDPLRVPGRLLAPAMLALIRQTPRPGIERPWHVIGVHVTFLNPAFDGKMVRQKADGSTFPDRKMLGEAQGGGLLLPGAVMRPDEGAAPLYDGEGIETVLSGMAFLDAPPSAVGLAVLSLDNLQGPVRKIGGAIPLYDPEPLVAAADADEPVKAAVAFAHGGPVTVLVDADMKPLRGPIDKRTGLHKGVRLIEVRRGPIVTRTMTSAERSAVCGVLAVKAWRAAGCRQVRAVRPPMGQDFNDAVREMRG
jgi:DNA primase